MGIVSSGDGTFACEDVAFEEIVFANYARAQISGGVTSQGVTINVVDPTGLPTLSSGQVFYAALEDEVHHREIVKVIARNGASLTVVRAQEGTTARAFVPGDSLSVILPAAALAGLRTQAVAQATAQACQLIKEASESIREEANTLAKALLDKYFPVGTIHFWLSTQSYPPNSIVLGPDYSRTVYKTLYALWGTMFGAGDGSTTFGTPKCPGYFLRFWDNGAGIDPDAAARTSRGDGVGGDKPGTYQLDQVKEHLHVMSVGRQGVAGGGAWAYGYANYGETDVADPVVKLFGGKETRPKNIYMIPMVRAL